MASLPVAVKFFLNQRKIVVIGVLRNPSPNKLRVLRTAQMLAKLPDGSERSVGVGRAKIVDPGGTGPFRLMLATFQYANALGAFTDECEEVEDPRGTPAQLKITIKNTPEGTNDEEELPIIVDDPDPNQGGNPPLDGPIDLYA
ncbi:hypothetical protein [Paludisphaera soli]|uniref:hypothetical protein n=1 Tax=Paludisphaera soli TaxID=2712865 RepID=UPI0013ED90F8|nr:hypothetical protein [Paludisphaera soli]